MITGFNTNCRYGGRVFHVQTEDSGCAHPHIITHLFFAGTILASQKQGYNDLLGSEDLTNQVRSLMEEQHKNMLRRLKNGEFDASMARRLDAGAVTDPQFELEEAVLEPVADGAPPGVEGIDLAVAAESQVAPNAPSGVEPQAESGPQAGPRAFGDGIVSQKPLDEVILDYLVEKARERARPADGRADGSRSRG